jgi:nitroimidazol reductase NimA-like FMN-containing flavoprotein (pyridoxamine 5'-phosphate oxidase superfamily)
MSMSEVDKLIEDQILCRIAFRGKNAPYIAPFQYTLLNDQLYFHFTDYGKKIGLLEEGHSACVEIEKYTPDFSEYRFVVLTGNLKIVSDPRERKRAIEKMVSSSKEKQLSGNFLVAHGFSKDEGWDSLPNEESIIIVKLDNLTEKIGLKSP